MVEGLDKAAVQPLNGCRRTMVSRRSGPVDTISMGTSHTSDMRSRYRRALTGSLSYSVMPTVNSDQPAISSRTGSASAARSEEHTSELQSLMRSSYAVFCLKQKQ